MNSPPTPLSMQHFVDNSPEAVQALYAMMSEAHRQVNEAKAANTLTPEEEETANLAFAGLALLTAAAMMGIALARDRTEEELDRLGKSLGVDFSKARFH